MSILKTALLKIKKVSEKDFKNCYNFIIKEYIDEDDINEETDLSSYNIDHLEELLDLDIIKAKGINIVNKGIEQKIFPLPRYSWDGGSAINTTQFNLKSLVSNDFGGGPIADIAVLKNPDCPGIVFYSTTDLSEIHIFM